MTLGVCIDPLNTFGRPSINALKDLNVQSVRFQARLNQRNKPDGRLIDYGRKLHRHSIPYDIVLDSLAFPDADYAKWAAIYAQSDLRPRYWLAGNEEDAPIGSESSWSMSSREYVDFYEQVASGLYTSPDREHDILAMGGLVSGQPQYLQDVLNRNLEPRYIDIHPYTQTPQSVYDLIQSYAQIYDVSYLALEWNNSIEELIGMVQSLNHLVVASSYFCWDDGMVSGFGLNSYGKPKPEYYAYKAALME